MVSNVKEYFVHHRLNSSDEWLEACVNWCKEQNPTSSNQKLVKDVLEQWLQTDLSEEGVQGTPSFPDDIGLGLKTVLNSTYTVQVQYAYDIGTSLYSQLQKAQKADTENASINVDNENSYSAAWQPKPTRMLMFVFHDGFRTMKGIEHRPIPSIKEPVPTGLKMTLTGPLTVRRGLILLVPDRITVHGGYVEEREEDFGLTTVLTSALRREETTHPFPAPSNYKRREPQEPKRKSIEHRNHHRSVRENMDNNDDNDDNDDTIMFDDNDDNLFSAIPIPNDESTTTTTFNVDFEDDDDDDELLRNLSMDTNDPTQEIAKVVNDRPFRYLSCTAITTTTTFTKDEFRVVKACITTLTSKLSMKPLESSAHRVWHISVIITDGSDSIQADLASEVLNKWIGFTPTEYAVRIRNDPALKPELKRCISAVSHKLLNFCGLAKIKFRGNESLPIVVETYEFNPGHLQQLKKRQI